MRLPTKQTVEAIRPSPHCPSLAPVPQALEAVCPRSAEAREAKPLYQNDGPLGQLTTVGIGALLSAP